MFANIAKSPAVCMAAPGHGTTVAMPYRGAEQCDQMGQALGKVMMKFCATLLAAVLPGLLVASAGWPDTFKKAAG